MTETTEKAILAGGCFRGMQNLLRKRPASSRPRWLHRRRRPQRHLSPPRHARRGDRDRLAPQRIPTDACTGSHADAAHAPPPR